MKMFYIGVLSYFGIPPEQFTQVCKHVVPLHYLLMQYTTTYEYRNKIYFDWTITGG